MEKEKRRKGPSCLGTILLAVVIVIGLKFVYAKFPKESSDPAAETEQEEQTGSEEGLPFELPFELPISDWLGKLGLSKPDENEPETAEEEPLYDRLYAALEAGEDSAVFAGDCTSELFDAFRQIFGEHPELFWLDGGGSAETVTRGTEITVTFKPDFLINKEEIPEARAKLAQAVDSVLAEIPEGASDYDRVLTVHDRLVMDTEYDHAAAAQFADSSASLGMSAGAYGCLVNKLAVCSGYAAAFRLLMNELEIPCLTVTGYDRENGMPHAWNCVSLDGDWYYVDVTWDDPAYADAGAFDRGISRECFLITTEELSLTHIIGEDQDPPDCTAMKENYYVKNGLTLPAYSFEAAAEILAPQLGGRMLCLKFPDETEAGRAVSELFGGQRFYEIAQEAGGVRYSIGRTGLLSIWPE